jgi:AcrR family transcriptional regulator
MTIEAVAALAGVGKPAIYRRFPDKVALVVAVIQSALPEMGMPDLGDTEAELRELFGEAMPPDADGYLTLIGGLISVQSRHPELIAAFRQHVLTPRRAIVEAAIARGQERGDIRADIPAVALLDMLAGPILARTFAGVDAGADWRREAFAFWWHSVRAA